MSLAKEATDRKHHDPDSPFPSKSEETIRVPMSQRQQDIHDYMMGKAPMWVRWKVRHGLPPSKSEARQLNAFMGGTRQVSNTTAGYHKSGMPESPKIDVAFGHLKEHLGSNPRAKAVVYSSFKRGGLHPYKARLEHAGIPHGEFSGDMPKHERNQMVQDYNAGKLKVLLISRAGAEGLDLKGTRLIQVMEPHWNEEHIKQVVGRGVRYKSHSHLPPEERHVHVQRFISIRRPKGVFERIGWKKPGYGTDEYVQRMAREKEHVNEQFRHILREAGDKPFHPQHHEGEKHASTLKNLAQSAALATVMGVAGHEFTRPIERSMVESAPALASQVHERAGKVRNQMAGAMGATGALLPLALRRKKGK